MRSNRWDCGRVEFALFVELVGRFEPAGRLQSLWRGRCCTFPRMPFNLATGASEQPRNCVNVFAKYAGLAREIHFRR